MKKHTRKTNYKEKGITLIALVVTIIVLLILAGVTLNLVLGQNGIINKSQYASNTWANATANEIIQMEEYTNGVYELTAGFIENGEGETGGGTGGGGSQTGGLTGVDFGAKTASTVETGDTVSIGTEQFMVLKNTNNTIMAMPYYNITMPNPVLPEENGTYPEQASSGTGTIAFVDSRFWTEKGVNIEPMTSSKIQKYITAYSNKLKGLTNNKVTAEVGRYYGDNALSSYSGQTNSESQKLLNPSGCDSFWLSSSASDVASDVRYVTTGGATPSIYYGTSNFCGVRPVIFISYP